MPEVSAEERMPSGEAPGAPAPERLTSWARRTASKVLGDYPRLYYPVMRRRERYKELLITPNTELVIEGYPRSGNTFAVAALQFAQPRPMSIARHTHYPAQVLEAVRLGLPTLVLAREPADAAASLVIREQFVTLHEALMRYRHYYRTIEGRRRGYVVASFPEVTGNFGRVIARLNAAFDLKLGMFQHSEENQAAVFRIVEDMERQAYMGVLAESRVARPSAARVAPKARLMAELAEPRHQPLLAECQDLFRRFTSVDV